MRTSAAIALQALCACWAGCANQKPQAAPTAAAAEVPGTSRTSPSAAVAAVRGAEPSATAVENDRRTCPCTVVGASTHISDIKGGAQIVVTAKSGRATEEIRSRASRLTSSRLANGDALSGGPSNCPIHYVAGTEAVVEEVRGGIRFSMTAMKQEAVEALRKSVRERASGLTRSASADIATGPALTLQHERRP